MTQSNGKMHWGEMIGGLFVVSGVILGAIRWWSGDTFWSSAGQVFIFLLAGGLITLIAEGLRTEKLGIKGGYIERRKHPFTFWIFVVFYVIVSIALIIMSIVYMLL